MGVVRQCVTRRTKIASSTARPLHLRQFHRLASQRRMHASSSYTASVISTMPYTPITHCVMHASSSYTASAQCPALLVTHTGVQVILIQYKHNQHREYLTACITLSSTPHPISYVHCTHIHPHTLQMQSANSVLLHFL